MIFRKDPPTFESSRRNISNTAQKGLNGKKPAVEMISNKDKEPPDKILSGIINEEPDQISAEEIAKRLKEAEKNEALNTAVRRAAKASISSSTKKKLCFDEKGRSRSYVATDPPSYVSLWRESNPDEEVPLRTDGRGHVCR